MPSTRAGFSFRGTDRPGRRRGLGTRLLKDALRRSLGASLEVGAFAVVVQAKDEDARSFYVRHGFIRLLDDEFRLFLPMATIEQAIR